MKIKRYVTGPIQVNTYLVYDEETKKGFIVDPGGYDKKITDDAKAESVDIEYIFLHMVMEIILAELSTLMLIFLCAKL